MILKYQGEFKPINQTKLGEMLLVNRSNVTGLIDRMEKADLVKRIPDREDRRVKLVEITKHGKQLLDNIEDTYYKRIEQIMSDLSESDHDLLCKLLESVRKGLK